MPSNRNIIAATVVALGYAFSSYAIAEDVFLKIDGIEGESADASHDREVVVLSLTTGLTTLDGLIRGKALPKAFTFTTPYSKASPKLLQTAAKGTHLKEAVFTVRSRVPNQPAFEYLKITLRAVLVDVATTTLSGTGRPVDYFELSYDFIEVKYTTRKPDGTVGDVVQMCWNIKTTEVC